eukprot:2486860-Pyramimonas_sp.AAC.1
MSGEPRGDRGGTHCKSVVVVDCLTAGMAVLPDQWQSLCGNRPTRSTPCESCGRLPCTERAL